MGKYSTRFMVHLVHHFDQNPGVLHFRNRGVEPLYLPYGGQRKALCLLRKLKLSFLGCKSGFESMVYPQRTGSGAENEDIYRDGGRESFRSYESYKSAEQ